MRTKNGILRYSLSEIFHSVSGVKHRAKAEHRGLNAQVGCLVSVIRSSVVQVYLRPVDLQDPQRASRDENGSDEAGKRRGGLYSGLNGSGSRGVSDGARYGRNDVQTGEGVKI